MAFKDPITSFPADAITGGTLGDDVIAQRVVAGDPAADHISLSRVTAVHAPTDVLGFHQYGEADPDYGVGRLYLDAAGNLTLELGPHGAPDVQVILTYADADTPRLGLYSGRDLQIAATFLELTSANATLNGLPLRPSAAGLITVTTDAGGLFDLPHGLGTAEHGVACISNQLTLFSLNSRGANNDVLHAYTVTGANKASATFNVSYVVTAT